MNPRPGSTSPSEETTSSSQSSFYTPPQTPDNSQDNDRVFVETVDEPVALTVEEQGQSERLTDLEALPFAQELDTNPPTQAELEEQQIKAFFDQLEAQRTALLNAFEDYTSKVSNCLGNISFFKSRDDLDRSHTITMTGTAALVLGTVGFVLNALSENPSVPKGLATGALMITSLALLGVHAMNNYGAQKAHIHAVDENKQAQFANVFQSPILRF